MDESTVRVIGDGDVSLLELPMRARRNLVGRTKEGMFAAKVQSATIISATRTLNDLKTQFDATTKRGGSSRPGTALRSVEARSSDSLPAPDPDAEQVEAELRTSYRVSSSSALVEYAPPRKVSPIRRSPVRAHMRPTASSISRFGAERLQRYDPSEAERNASPAVAELRDGEDIPLIGASGVGTADETRFVENRRTLAEERRRGVEWLGYWGQLQKLRDSNKNLLDELEGEAHDAQRLAEECEAYRLRLDNAAKDVQDLSETLENERRHANNVLETEKRKYEALLAENERLMAKANEMRRQVTLAENAMYKLRQDTDAALKAASKAKAELEEHRMQHAIEIVKLKHEANSRVQLAGDKEVRLIYLEDENARQADHLRTLSKTVEVLTAENKSLHERVQAMTADLPRAQARNVTGVDATSLQQLTQKSFQKREAELLSQLTTLRRDNDDKRFLITALKKFIEGNFTGYESALMTLNDVDAATGIAFQMPKRAAPLFTSPARGAATSGKGGGGKAGGAAKGPQRYTCVALQFPEVQGQQTDEELFGARVPTSVYATQMEVYRQLVWKNLAEICSAMRSACETLWEPLSARIPADSRGSPDGEKEKIHFTVQTHLNAAIAAAKLAAKNHLAALEEWLEKERQIADDSAQKVVEVQRTESRRVGIFESKFREKELRVMTLESELATLRDAGAAIAENVAATATYVAAEHAALHGISASNGLFVPLISAEDVPFATVPDAETHSQACRDIVAAMRHAVELCRAAAVKPPKVSPPQSTPQSATQQVPNSVVEESSGEQHRPLPSRASVSSPTEGEQSQAVQDAMRMQSERIAQLERFLAEANSTNDNLRSTVEQLAATSARVTAAAQSAARNQQAGSESTPAMRPAVVHHFTVQQPDGTGQDRHSSPPSLTDSPSSLNDGVARAASAEVPTAPIQGVPDNRRGAHMLPSAAEVALRQQQHQQQQQHLQLQEQQQHHQEQYQQQPSAASAVTSQSGVVLSPPVVTTCVTTSTPTPSVARATIGAQEEKPHLLAISAPQGLSPATAVDAQQTANHQELTSPAPAAAAAALSHTPPQVNNVANEASRGSADAAPLPPLRSAPQALSESDRATQRPQQNARTTRPSTGLSGATRNVMSQKLDRAANPRNQGSSGPTQPVPRAQPGAMIGSSRANMQLTAASANVAVASIGDADGGVSKWEIEAEVESAFTNAPGHSPSAGNQRLSPMIGAPSMQIVVTPSDSPSISGRVDTVPARARSAQIPYVNTNVSSQRSHTDRVVSATVMRVSRQPRSAEPASIRALQGLSAATAALNSRSAPERRPSPLRDHHPSVLTAPDPAAAERRLSNPLWKTDEYDGIAWTSTPMSVTSSPGARTQLHISHLTFGGSPSVRGFDNVRTSPTRGDARLQALADLATRRSQAGGGATPPSRGGSPVRVAITGHQLQAPTHHLSRAQLHAAQSGFTSTNVQPFSYFNTAATSSSWRSQR